MTTVHEIPDKNAPPDMKAAIEALAVANGQLQRIENELTRLRKSRLDWEQQRRLCIAKIYEFAAGQQPTGGEIIRKMDEENKVKDRCPVCGHQFDEVKPVNVCPTSHPDGQEFAEDQLIGCWDDYAWCL